MGALSNCRLCVKYWKSPEIKTNFPQVFLAGYETTLSNTSLDYHSCFGMAESIVCITIENEYIANPFP